MCYKCEVVFQNSLHTIVWTEKKKRGRSHSKTLRTPLCATCHSPVTCCSQACKIQPKPDSFRVQREVHTWLAQVSKYLIWISNTRCYELQKLTSWKKKRKEDLITYGTFEQKNAAAFCSDDASIFKSVSSVFNLNYFHGRPGTESYRSYDFLRRCRNSAATGCNFPQVFRKPQLPRFPQPDSAHPNAPEDKFRDPPC